MKKKSAKIIGTVLLVSMIISLVCPGAVLAAEPLPTDEIAAETTLQQETQQEETSTETAAIIQETVQPEEPEATPAEEPEATQPEEPETSIPEEPAEQNHVIIGTEEGILTGSEILVQTEITSEPETEETGESKAAEREEETTPEVKDLSENVKDETAQTGEDREKKEQETQQVVEEETIAAPLPEEAKEKNEIILEEIRIMVVDGAERMSETVKELREDTQANEEKKAAEIPAETLFDNSTTAKDGIYTQEDQDVTFIPPEPTRVTITIEKVIVENGKATAVMKTTSGTQTHVYVGSNEDLTADEDKLQDAEGNLITNVYAITDKTFTIPVKLNEATKFKIRTTAMSEPMWTGYEYTINIPEPDATGEIPFDNTTTVKDGTYTEEDENVTFTPPKPTKVTITIEKVIVENGKATAVMKTTSGTQTHVYVGSNEDLTADEDKLQDAEGNLITNVYAITDKTFTIPVKLNEATKFKIRTTAMSEPMWTGYEYTITISEDTPLPKEADYSKVKEAKEKVPEDLSIYTDESVAVLQKALDAVEEGKMATEQETVDAWAKAIEEAIAGLEKKDGTPVAFEDLTDGTYTATVSCNAPMFPVGKICTVTLKDGVFDVVIKMKSKENTAQTKVYRGKKEDAPDHPDSWIEYELDENDIYTFTLKDVPIGEEFDLASYSKNRDTWYDRKLIIDKDSFVKGTERDPDEDKKEDEKKDDKKDDKKDSDPSKPDDSKTPEDNSSSESDLSGATAAVDSSTALPDGVYTPDSFAFSGGTGRVTITCRQVTVIGGQAYATIVISSAKYGYVKAGGGIYYPTIEGGTSVFTIPVQLNVNNTIIGMTTAMSAPHEITYSIFVYIAAADGQQQTAENNDTIGEKNQIDETAPVIAGLTGGSEIKLEHAELLKLFRYDNGCVLVEIDRTKGTVLDPEKRKTESADTTANTAKSADAAQEVTEAAAGEEETGSTSNIKTDADYAMELYQEDVVKYLIVPEGVELPAGMEKQVILIQMPKKSVYAASEEAADKMAQLGLLDLVKAVGVKEENCTNETLKKAYQEKKIIFGGDIKDINYTELVKANADLMIGAGEEFLPKEEEKDKTAEDYQALYTKVSERMALLNIPMLIDRSAGEKDPKGQLEWLKLYGILFGKEEEADALIAKGVR